ASGPSSGPFGPVATKFYSLTNTGVTALIWKATPSAAWLTVSPDSGTLSPGAATNIAVSVTSGTNAPLPGQYVGAVHFTSLTDGGHAMRKCAVEVWPRLTLTPEADYAASGPAGGPFTPAAQTYSIANIGAAPALWSVGTTSSWFSASPLSGT